MEKERFNLLQKFYYRTIGALAHKIRAGIVKRGYKKDKEEWGLKSMRLAYSCPCCGYDDFDMGEEPYFKLEESGESPGGEYTTYWFEGTQTCPRCGYEWPYSDSTP